MNDDEQLRYETETGEADVAFYSQRAEVCRLKMLSAKERHYRVRVPVVNWERWREARDAYVKALDDWQFACYQLEKAKANVQP